MNTNKTAMIWGASGGIGRALTQRLHSDGWQVAAFSRRPEQMTGITPLSYEADVSKPDAIRDAIYQAGLEIDTVGLWVYAAGDIVQEKVSDNDPTTFRRILDANLTGAVLTTQASYPLLANDAHLIYLGAVSERLRLPSLSAYAAAKSALEAWVATAAKEDRHRNYLVVRPGAVDTPFWDRVGLRKPKDAADPAAVADKIVTAFAASTTGTLDITH